MSNKQLIVSLIEGVVFWICMIGITIAILGLAPMH